MKLNKKGVDKGIVAYREFQSPRKTVSAIITAYFEALQASGKAELLENSPGLVSRSRTFLAAELPVLIIRME